MIGKWSARYLQQALLIADWSKDPSNKTGCVISSPENIVIGQGFNGFPKGVLDNKEILADKKRKRFRTVHAELNAMIFSTGSLIGSTFHITHRPCAICSSLIIQRKPAKIISLVKSNLSGINNSGLDVNELSDFWEESIAEGREMFKEANIEYVTIDYDSLTSYLKTQI